MTPLNDFRVLVTADEGYRALEQAVLDATTRIDMGFRVFDPRTPVLSDAAAKIGETWADLLVHKLNQGVKVSITLSDFDPVVRPKLHQSTWKSFGVLAGVAEMSDKPNNLKARIESHPARVGLGPRIALWPKVQSQIMQTCDGLNAMDAAGRDEALRYMPRMRDLLIEKEGVWSPRRNNFAPMIPVTHHQKLAVIDDEVLYIGGLDVNSRRLDTPDHHGPASDTWHDVQVIVRDGARAQAARRHIDRFSAECSGDVSVQPPEGLLRTLSVRRENDKIALSPVVCDAGILDRHLALIEKAERLIYLESQFLRDPVIADALAKRAATAPDLGVIVVLPASPLEIAFDGEDGLDFQYGDYLQATCLAQMRAAYGDRLMVASPVQPKEAIGQDRSVLHGAPMIFVHSKVSVFDDVSGIVSSANLNGRSMRWDTEMGIEVADPEQVRHLREAVMRAWLPENAGAEFTAARPETVDHWRKLAVENTATPPTSRRGFLVPHEDTPAREAGTRLLGIPVEMV